jgi:hypothetical protein
MECGWDAPLLATLKCPDGDPNGDPRVPGPCEAETYYDYQAGAEECHQICLADPKCKSYQVDAKYNYWPCRIFYIPLGTNATNVPSPTPGGKIWWDRNCQAHLPSQCGQPAKRTAAPVKNVQRATEGLEPVITAAPISAAPQDLEVRDVDVPKYIRDIMGVFPQGLTPACSCLITSARPPASATTTLRFLTWTATTVSLRRRY